ncbi:MAG: DUF4160 domain-containing protein [Bacteroidota bacterium]
MPTVLIIFGYRFFFYSNDHEPIHIHIEKNAKTAKFNLEPIELVKNSKFNASDLKEIRNIIEENKVLMKSKWNEYFNK